MFASIIGPVDGVRCLSKEAMNQARREQWRGIDVVMSVENALRLGFLLPTEWCPLGRARLLRYGAVWRVTSVGQSRTGACVRVHPQPLLARAL